VETELLSQWEVCEGNMEGGSFTGEPKIYVKEGTGNRYLSIGTPLGNLEGFHLPGSLRYSNIRAPFLGPRGC